MYQLIPDFAPRLADNDVLVDVSGGPGSWSEGFSWQGASRTWLAHFDLPTGPDPVTGTVSCPDASSDVNYTITYATRPFPPVTFQGTIGLGNVLGFDAPELAHYRANVSLSGGSVTLRLGGRSQTFTAPGGDFDIGMLDAGDYDLELVGTGDPQSDYSIAIDEDPPAVADITTSSRYVRPGGSVTMSFRVSGPVFVEKYVYSRSGGDLVTPIQAVGDFPPGLVTVTWDGRNGSGAPAPDGDYALAANVSNDAPGGNSAQADVRVDGTAPTLKVTVPGRADRPLLAIASDLVGASAGSGIAQVTASVDGGPPQLLAPATPSWEFSYLPFGGWSAGRHTAVVVASDGAGNQTKQTVTFTISAVLIPPKPPTMMPAACDRQAARSAVRHTGGLTRPLRRAARLRHGDVFRAYTLASLVCADLTRDAKRELAVLLKPRSRLKREGHTTAAVAVFRQAGRSWRLSFKTVRRALTSMRRRGSDLVLTQHLASHRRRSFRLHWRGARFVLLLR